MKKWVRKVIALNLAIIMSVGLFSFRSEAAYSSYGDNERFSIHTPTLGDIMMGDKTTLYFEKGSNVDTRYGGCCYADDIIFKGDEATFEGYNGDEGNGEICATPNNHFEFMNSETGATNPFTLNLTKSVLLTIKDDSLRGSEEPFLAYASVLKLKGNGTLSLEIGDSSMMGLYCASDLYVDGVNLVINTKGSCGLSVHDINISSGSIDITASNASKDEYGCIVYNKINLGDGMGIVEPENAVIKQNSYGESVICNSDGSYAKHVKIAKKSSSSDESESGSSSGNSSKGYSNEWAGGKWYDADGSQTYTGTLSWKSDASGWWVEDSSGWYPKSQWQKIDGTWYFFKPDGYMASNEYYNGYWFNKDGSWDEKYFLSWKSNDTGWWVEDKSGWWPASSWLKIDGYWYYFDASGYMVTNQYVDGWWISADGVCY